MKKAEKKVFISSEEDRGVLIKFLKDKVRLSFWGNEEDIPKEIVFSNEDILELCTHVTEEINKEKSVSSRQYVTGLLDEMNARNNERR